MILPRDHPVSTFIVRHYHEYLGHTGREHVLTTLRQRFWLLQARTLVRQVLRKCVSCRKRNEAPMQQLMADLPKDRLIPFEPPFTYTGVGFFGPFHVKRKRSADKVYWCLFTCLQVVRSTSRMFFRWRPTPLSKSFEGLFQIVAIQKKYGATMRPILLVLRRRVKRTPEEGRDQLLSMPENRVEISTPDG